MKVIILDTLVTGLPFVTCFAGIYLLFRILQDFDLTVDGTFITGGGVCVVLLMHGVPAPIATLIAIGAGGAMGLITTALHIGLRIPVLLAGLLMSLALFSINLHIMGQPTLSLLSGGVFSPFASMSSTARDLATSGLLLGIDLAVLGLLALFLKTEIGLALRATGINTTMARAQGVNQSAIIALALVLANGLAALGGALTVQGQGFADINGGAGTLIAGAGALLLGELLLRPTPSKVGRAMSAVLVGSVLYRLVLVLSLRLGLAATDLKLVTAVTLIIAVAGQLAVRQLSTWTAGLSRPKSPSRAAAGPLGQETL